MEISPTCTDYYAKRADTQMFFFTTHILCYGSIKESDSAHRSKVSGTLD